MKTLLFCTSLFDSDNTDKYESWWHYYSNKFSNCDKLIINDGKIDDLTFLKLQSWEKFGFNPNINLKLFDSKLGKDNEKHWGWYRSFRYALMYGVSNNYDKIIHVEADAVIVSDRLINYLNNQNNGWWCLFSKHYGFKESAIQVVNRDAFNLIENLPEMYDFEKIAEWFLPFWCNKSFIGDRYGELGKLPSHKIDYACQWNWDWAIEKDWIIE